MTTYTATRSQLSLALADVMDFAPLRAAGFDSFAALADALIASGHFGEHSEIRGSHAAVPEPTYLDDDRTEARRERAREAGRALGAESRSWAQQQVDALPAGLTDRQRETLTASYEAVKPPRQRKRHAA